MAYLSNQGRVTHHTMNPTLERDLLPEVGGRAVELRPARHASRPPMKKEVQVRFTAIVLALFTVAAVIFAVINFRKELEYRVPYDGVWWVEREGWLKAERVVPGSPGDKAGIKDGDELVAVNNRTVNTVAALTARQFRAGVWNSATYSLVRSEVPVNVSVILTPADKSLYVGLRLIALIYLGIGLFVFLRRWTAPKSTHFYVFCLVSFIFYSFKYVGNWSLFDTSVYWCNVVAWLLQPALFLHFALTFPEAKGVFRRHWLLSVVYLPALLLLAVHIWVLQTRAATELLRWNLDRVEMLYLTVFFAIAALVFRRTYRRADTPILRQQMKWVYRGTLLAITPFTLFYVIPYLSGRMPTTLMAVSAFSLVFLPLTFGYAIVRYRLMDVDIIFKRGMAYTLAAAAIVGLYFGAVGLVAEIVHKSVPGAGYAGLVIAMIVAALLFDPVKNWIQVRLDRVFYKKRYDYRRTLVEFGRELSSETDLNKMLSAVTDRLSRTLLVDRVAIFLSDPRQPERFLLAKSFGMSSLADLDLSFLERADFAEGHMFYENTHQVLHETPAAQQAIARLDLNYYIPCTVQNRIISVLGLGKTIEGDFLSSEDVELLQTLAGYIGIAIQNARLYASLEQKVLEYERLKDFNENIVESINVGVLAVDLDDRIESWNSQMEVMYATPRAEALGRSLREVFSASFLEDYYRFRQNSGIHNLYKFRLDTPAGPRITNMAIAPLVTRRFHVIGRLIIVDDITERVALESQLSQADKLSSIGLLAAGVAHEVNTPLAVISSYAQMLAKQLQGDEQKSGLLEKITRQSFRASEIVNNLLNFSRTTGTEFSSVSLNKVIADTLALLEHQFRTARITVRDDLAPDLPSIHGSPGRLQQVFLNLFLNAKDAMAENGGTLTVSTSNGEGVNVTISDTGAGIPPEHVHRIYDPFFTTKAAPREGQGRGTGLGLSVTYGIIQEHAGKIRVESRPGEGTTFILEFPLIRKAVNV